MGEEKSYEMQRLVQRNYSIAEEYLKMNPEDALAEWSRIRGEKSSLQKKLKEIELRETVLEFVPAVAEQRVKDNKITTALLYEIYVKGGRRVREIYSANPDNVTRIIIIHSLDLLKKAGFVEYDGFFRTSITNLGEAFCAENMGAEHDR